MNMSTADVSAVNTAPTFKLAIGNIVKVPVEFLLNIDGKDTPFAFSLTCERRSEAELSKAADDTCTAFLMDVVKGWNGQTVVVDDGHNPAAFSREALAVMLGVCDLAKLIVKAYQIECRAKIKD